MLQNEVPEEVILLFDWSFTIILVTKWEFLWWYHSYKGEMKHKDAELRNPAAALTVAVSNPLY